MKKKLKKVFLGINIVLLLLFFGMEVEGANYITAENNNSDIKNVKNSKSICEYKKGEVIITYKHSFWNSKVNITADSICNDFSIDNTVEFNQVKIDESKKVNVTSNNSESSSLRISLIKSTKHSTEELLNIFKGKDWIISVEPNYIIKPASLTNDTYEKYQWALENSGQNGGCEGLDINPISSTSNNEKVIAVIDTGVDYTHEDLKNSMWENPYSESELKGQHGYNFVDDTPDPMDNMYHGTHVAGIIAAGANNNKGISGAVLDASNIKIMALKALDENGGTDDLFTIVKAYNYIYKAQQLGTNVVAINNSWGGFGAIDDDDDSNFFNSLTSVMNLVGENGAISICAAGNDGYEIDENGEIYLDAHDIFAEEEQIEQYADQDYSVCCKCFPAGLDSKYIISVAASNQYDNLANFSNYGECIDISAPGTNILSTTTNYISENKNNVSKQFIPSIYTEEKLKETCDEYWNFENCRDEDIPFTANIGKISITDEMSFGTGKKCLKWEFDISENELQNLENMEYPELTFNKEYEWYGWVSAMINGFCSTGYDLNLAYCTRLLKIGDDLEINDGGSSTIKNGQKYWEKLGRITGCAWNDAKAMDLSEWGIEKNPFDGNPPSRKTKIDFWCI